MAGYEYRARACIAPIWRFTAAVHSAKSRPEASVGGLGRGLFITAARAADTSRSGLACARHTFVHRSACMCSRGKFARVLIRLLPQQSGLRWPFRSWTHRRQLQGLLDALRPGQALPPGKVHVDGYCVWITSLDTHQNERSQLLASSGVSPSMMLPSTSGVPKLSFFSCNAMISSECSASQVCAVSCASEECTWWCDNRCLRVCSCHVCTCE